MQVGVRSLPRPQSNHCTRGNRKWFAATWAKRGSSYTKDNSVVNIATVIDLFVKIGVTLGDIKLPLEDPGGARKSMTASRSLNP